MMNNIRLIEVGSVSPSKTDPLILNGIQSMILS